MRRLLCCLLAVAGLFGACSGGDDDAGTDGEDASTDDEVAARFCDVYLDYLADSSPANLDAAVDAADDDEVRALAETIDDSASSIDRVLAATADLDELARQRCQPEWTAGAQGAGSTAAAAQAFGDAIGAGDRFGARNVASANAIAALEPWDDSGDVEVTVVDVGEREFGLVVDDGLVQCQVETGVVVTCTTAG